MARPMLVRVVYPDVEASPCGRLFFDPLALMNQKRFVGGNRSTADEAAYGACSIRHSPDCRSGGKKTIHGARKHDERAGALMLFRFRTLCRGEDRKRWVKTKATPIKKSAGTSLCLTLPPHFGIQ